MLEQNSYLLNNWNWTLLQKTIKSDWKPDPGSNQHKSTMKLFKITLVSTRYNIRRQRKAATDLTKKQEDILNSIQNNNDIIIVNCDNNLRPAVMCHKTYIKEIIYQHLQDKTKTYRIMIDHEDLSRLNVISIRLIKIFTNKLHTNKIHKKDNNYFTHSLSDNKKFAQFYGMAKLHKNKIPVPLRPVVSQCGSRLGSAYTYLYYNVQPLTKLILSYLRDSHHVITLLKKVGKLSFSTQLFE